MKKLFLTILCSTFLLLSYSQKFDDFKEINLINFGSIEKGRQFKVEFDYVYKFTFDNQVILTKTKNSDTKKMRYIVKEDNLILASDDEKQTFKIVIMDKNVFKLVAKDYTLYFCLSKN